MLLKRQQLHTGEEEREKKRGQAQVETKCIILQFKQTAVDYGGEINMLDNSHFPSAQDEGTK